MRRPLRSLVAITAALLLGGGMALAPATDGRADSDVTINEFGYDPDDGRAFIELYNSTDAPLPVSGFVVTSIVGGTAQSLPVGDFWVPAHGQYATTLTISPIGGISLWSSGTSGFVDQLRWHETPEHSYIRCPEGSGVWHVSAEATPGATNACGTAIGVLPPLHAIRGTISPAAGMPAEWLRGVNVGAARVGSDDWYLAKPDPDTGEYEIPGLGDGEWEVGIAATNYFDGTSWVWALFDSEYYVDVADRADATPITLAGDDATEIDFTLGVGDAPPTDPTRSITGTIRLETGADASWLAGLAVTALRTSPATVVAGTIDPATGDYRIDGLEPGSWAVHVDTGSLALAPEYYADAATLDAATPVDLTSTDAIDVDFELARTSYAMSGTVVLPAGSDPAWLGEITVVARNIDPNATLQIAVASLDTATGDYRFPALPTGGWKIGLLPGDAPLTERWYPDAADIGTALPILVNTDAHGLDLTPARTSYAMSGTVVLPAGSDPAWLGEITVVARNIDPNATLQIAVASLDTATGDYRFPALPTGGWKIGLLPGDAPLTERWYPDAADIGTALPILVNTDAHGLDLTPARTSYRISGTISLPAGADAADLAALQVYAFGWRLDGPLVFSGAVDASTGDYAFPLMPEGTWRILVTADGTPYADRWVGGGVSLATATPITLAGADIVRDVTMTAGARPAIDVAAFDTLLRGGDQFEYVAEGFVPYESVEIWLHSTPVRLATTAASATGAVALTLAIPPGTAAGAHHLVATGLSSGRSVSSAVQVAALPTTGADLGPLAWLGALLIGLGLAATASVRRRRAQDPVPTT